MKRLLLTSVFIVVMLFGTGASGATRCNLEIVTTTTIVADLAENVAGSGCSVTSLLRPGIDPHTYRPLPSDMKKLSAADIILVHGAGLDIWAEKLVASSGTKALVVTVTSNIDSADEDDHEHDHADHDDDHDDPHYWFDPTLVESYVDVIEDALITADATRADIYRKNALSYRKELDELDAWIEKQLAQISPANRKLVTNHAFLDYFARRYNFAVVATVIPSSSPDAEPSVRQLVDSVKAMQRDGVKAVFAETTVNTKLANLLASQAGLGVKVIQLFTGSLSAPDGPANSYIRLMQYNVEAILEGLL